ncbi:MAG: helix-turn-helix domain-containing protein, partial [Ruthenibacterium sp.]
MAITVELYKEVRRMHLDGVSQRQIATRLCISRNTVRKYLDGNVVPWERKATARPATVLRPEVLTFIENCLETDRREGTKKQHHTAKRIYDRLVAEQKFQGGESTIRAYVRALREKTREA